MNDVWLVILGWRGTSLKDKVCIITGANFGLGKATAIELAKLGATLVMVCRDKDRGNTALKEVRNTSGSKSIELLIADMSSQQSIHDLAGQFKSKYDRLDVLVNNAGAIIGNKILSADGIEMTFALNHLGYFLLTHLLIDYLKASAPSRIVNVASGAHYGGEMNFDDLQFEKKYDGWKAYGLSKLANVLFTYELVRRLEGTGVTANCLHPGVVNTGFGNSGTAFFSFMFKLIKPFLISETKGAETQIYLSTSPELETVSGKYFSKKKAVKSSKYSYSGSAAKRLWDISLEMTGVDNI